MVKIEVGGKPIFDLLPGVEVVNSRSGRSSGYRTVNTSSRTQFAWSTVLPRLIITSDTNDFDEELISHFKAEGFQTRYLQYEGNKQSYHNQLNHLSDQLELGEQYAIVAYGDAAALVLEACMRPMPKLCAVVAYYPPFMPKTSANFSPTLQVAIHLAGDQKFGTRHEKNFRYPNTDSGFAESDLDEYSKPESRVAWTRTLATLRRGFGISKDLESTWDYHSKLLYNTTETDMDEILKTTTSDASVINVPTGTGGVGKREVKRFYEHLFIGTLPSDFKTRLLSRTQGVDRIVDEMFVSFTHSNEMPWILPGIPATGEKVEVVLVVIAALRGHHLTQQHLYWVGRAWCFEA